MSNSQCRNMENIVERIRLTSEKLSNLEKIVIGDSISRVKREIFDKSVLGNKFVTVPRNYYHLSLQDRASLLRAVPSQLCKSIIFENTACEHVNFTDKTYSRYYCVIIQYEGGFFIQYHLISFISSS